MLQLFRYSRFLVQNIYWCCGPQLVTLCALRAPRIAKFHCVATVALARSFAAHAHKKREALTAARGDAQSVASAQGAGLRAGLAGFASLRTVDQGLPWAFLYSKGPGP